MINVTRNEAQYLRSRGRGEDIHISSITKNSRGKRYYVTQSHAAMKLLWKYRESMISDTYER